MRKIEWIIFETQFIDSMYQFRHRLQRQLPREPHPTSACCPANTYTIVCRAGWRGTASTPAPSMLATAGIATLHSRRFPPPQMRLIPPLIPCAGTDIFVWPGSRKIYYNSTSIRIPRESHPTRPALRVGCREERAGGSKLSVSRHSLCRRARRASAADLGRAVAPTPICLVEGCRCGDFQALLTVGTWRRSTPRRPQVLGLTTFQTGA
eukprot:COSAG02_NODE_258_length_26815_cov_12.034998_11_plen_208_part_00